MNKEGRAIHSLLVTGYKAHELGIFQESHQGVHYLKKND
ncbi:SLOG family protein [Shouchella clausii]|nr:SLOG family protein [Shouchella clausii]